MEIVQLKASLRDGKGKTAARRLRAQDLIPAVLYGKAAEKPLNLSLDPKALRAIVTSSAHRLNTVMKLDVNDGAERLVLIKDYQLHPVSRALVHVDLIQVKADELVAVKVPIAYVGTSPALKDGGNFQALRRELVVHVLPTNIPLNITIDTSKLMIGDNIHLNDVKLPEGVIVKSNVNFTICSMEAPEADDTKRGGAAAAAPAAPAAAAKPAKK